MAQIGRAIAFALIVGAAGCGYAKNKGDETSVTPPPAAPKERPVANPGETFGITYQVKFSGLVPLEGSFTQPVSSREYKNCMDYVIRHNEGYFDIEGGKTGGHEFNFSIEVPMKGAGTYTPESEASVALTFDSKTERYLFGSFGKNSPASVTVNPDGSGTATFTNWENDSREHESGSLSWTCGKRESK